MQTLNYNILNILKSYLPNKTFNLLSATCNEICSAPITQTEIKRRVCVIYLSKYHDCYQHVKCIKYMIKKGYDIRREYNYILRASAEHGYLKVVKYLIEVVGLTIKDVRTCGNYCLVWSADKGHFHVVKYLIEVVGLNLQDIRTNKSEAFSYSAGSGHIKIANYFIKMGLTVEDIRESNIANWCALSGNLDILKYIVDKGINIKDIRFYDLLRKSARSGYLNIVKYLIEEIGLDIEDVRSNDNYILKQSVEFKQVNILKYIIEEIGLTEEDVRSSDVLKEAVSKGQKEMVKILMSKVKNVSVTDLFGEENIWLNEYINVSMKTN